MWLLRVAFLDRCPYHVRMRDLIHELGGPTAVARMLGIRAPSVIGWRGRIPAERCPHIEKATEGRWPCERLRPDVAWARVADPHWPHPAGRPCIDAGRRHGVIGAQAGVEQ